MNNNKNTKDQIAESQIARIKGLMKFGLNEGKNVAYTGVEYEKVAADGKLYGIVREGAKYYIKTSPSKKGKLAENYEYIGGFRNRKSNEYSSFAEAQKQFDLKMMSINEANTPDKKIVIDSWNPDKQEMLTVESTNKMKREIARERQIMMNATRINEKKEQSLQLIGEKKQSKCGCEECDDKECGIPKSHVGGPNARTAYARSDKFTDGYDFKDAENPKNSFRSQKHEEGDAKKANKGYKTVRQVKEGAEPLAWHETGKDAQGNIADTYMDKSHGTEIGSSAPFDAATAGNIDKGDKKPVTDTPDAKNGVVEEGEAMHDAQNQNTPAPGTKGRDNAKHVDDPFNDKKGRDITEDIDDIDDDPDVEDTDSIDGDDNDADFDDDDTISTDDLDANGDDDFGDESDDDLGDESDDDFDTDDIDDGDDEGTDPDIADLQNQIAALTDKVDQLLDAQGVDEPPVDDSNYQDDDLYDDDNDAASDDDDDDSIEDCTVYETRAFRRARRLAEARNRRHHRLNEDDMKPFSDRGRVPSGNMNKLNDFGKHPAYQKKVMSLPPKDMQEFPDYYDMNDESTHSDAPYGSKIGSGKPFDVDPEELTNAIAESIKRYMGKKLVR